MLMMMNMRMIIILKKIRKLSLNHQKQLKLVKSLLNLLIKNRVKKKRGISQTKRKIRKEGRSVKQ